MFVQSAMLAFVKRFVVLAAILILGNGLVPVCGGMCCPLAPDVPIAHAEMPCCAPGASMGPQDFTNVQPGVVSAGVSVIHGPAEAGPTFAALMEAPRIAIAIDAPELHEPSPPLFLRNAQLLI